VDSATMMNKGLEFIEAMHLFSAAPDQITVLIHPESVVHSAVEFTDGSVIAQMAAPDMVLPIQYALFYPDRLPMDTPKADFYEIANLTFEKPDTETFKGLSLALDAAREGGSMPTVFNAANEKAVSLFLNGRISFLGIADTIEKSMASHRTIKDPTVDDILAAEKETYSYIESLSL
jgi:1-deoxy-D-xylulose-5-phosphate reductoisomerase